MNRSNARIGLVLFVLYLLFYGGFVFLNAFDAERMDETPLLGINLAILYGMGLIVAAVVLAALYGLLCTMLAMAGDQSEDGA